MPTTAPLRTRQDLDPVRLRQVFGAFPTGVVAVAAQVDGRLVGLAASSFTSVSLDPPLVSVSVPTGSRTWSDLRRSPHIGITVLAAHHEAACRQLAGPVEDRFTGLDVRVGEGGAAVLADGLARFAVTLHDEVAAGDHTLVLLRLHAVAHPADDVRGPLVFHRSGFGTLA